MLVSIPPAVVVLCVVLKNTGNALLNVLQLYSSKMKRRAGVYFLSVNPGKHFISGCPRPQ